jgi:hypothetical protein
MSLFKRQRAVEIVALSGTLRVTVNPRPAWVLLFIEVVVAVVFGVMVFGRWGSMALGYRILLVWAEASAVISWFYQLSGSEVVEFDTRKLSVSKQVLGWNRTTEYSVNDCRELQWHTQSEGDSYGLQCKVGWRTVKFGEYISEDEAIDVLTALQSNLPDVAQRMCAMPDTSKKRFTTLGLS